MIVVIVVVHVTAVLVVSMPEHKVTIDRLAFAVDHLDVVQQPVGGLRLADLGDQLGDGVVLLVHAADLARPCGRTAIAIRAYSISSSSSATSIPSALATARSARSALTACTACGREPSKNSCGSWPVADNHAPEVDALRLELAGDVLHPRLHLGVDHRLRRVDVDEAGERLGERRHHGLARLVELAARQPLADRRCPLLDGLELAGVVGDPFVGGLGHDQLLHRLDLDGEVGRLLRALRVAGERELVAGLGAGEPVVEVVGDPALAELVREVLGVEAGDLLAVARGSEVDRQEVAGLGRAIDVAERTGGPQLGLLGLLDLGRGRLDCVELDPQPAVAGDGDLRADLALGLELDDPFLLAAGDLDLRCGDEIDVVLADRLAEVSRDRLAQRLLACGADADPGLEHPAGRLAVAESGQFHLAGDGLERLVDVTIELGLVDLDVHLDLVPLEGFNRRLHETGHPTGGNVRRRRLDPAEWRPMQIWKPHALATPHPDQLDLRIGDRVRATVDLIGVPQGTEGKVLLANGFNWLRYRVLFDNGAEAADLDQRNIEPIGRAAKRVRKREKKAAARAR